MDERRGGRLGSFVVGGIIGSIAGAVAAGRMRVRDRSGERTTPEGLAAFEGAPCFQEVLDREAADRAKTEAAARE
jgi:gas vesicle protein